MSFRCTGELKLGMIIKYKPIDSAPSYGSFAVVRIYFHEKPKKIYNVNDYQQYKSRAFNSFMMEAFII